MAVELQRLGVREGRHTAERRGADWFQRIGGGAAIVSGLWLATATFVFGEARYVGDMRFGQHAARMDSNPVVGWYDQAGGVMPFILVLGIAGIWWALRRAIGALGHGGFAIVIMAAVVMAMEARWPVAFLHYGSPLVLIGGMAVGVLLTVFALLRGRVMPALAAGLLMAGIVISWLGAASGSGFHSVLTPLGDFLAGAAVVRMGWEALRRRDEGVSAT